MAAVPMCYATFHHCTQIRLTTNKTTFKIEDDSNKTINTDYSIFLSSTKKPSIFKVLHLVSFPSKFMTSPYLLIVSLYLIIRKLNISDPLKF